MRPQASKQTYTAHIMNNVIKKPQIYVQGVRIGENFADLSWYATMMTTANISFPPVNIR